MKRSTAMRAIYGLLMAAICVALSEPFPQQSAAASPFTLYLPFVQMPDTSRIAYIQSSIGCPCSIGIIHPDGTNDVALALTAGPTFLYFGDLAWSPDGAYLVFGAQSKDETQPPGIYRISSDGTNLVKLADTSYVPSGISWSPDGQQIAFSNDNEIYVMRADGSTRTQLTRNAGRNLDPTWSPDSQHIAFSSDRHGQSGIYIMRADGADPQLIGSASAIDWDPAWSPDGQHIAFTRWMSETSTIYVMNADGTDARQLVDFGTLSYSASGPAWSPDGQRIVFMRHFFHFSTISVIGIDGSGMTAVAGGGSPVWTR